MFVRYCYDALINILSARLRSLLAVLGILVGTAAVVALMTCSRLATLHAVAQFKTLGTQLLAVNISNHQAASGSQLSKKLDLESVDQIKSVSDSIIDIAPYTYSFSSIFYHGDEYEGLAVGVVDNFYSIAKLQLDKGRFISVLDRRQPFAVIGADLAKKLAQKGVVNPVGHQLLLGNLYFTIIGILKPWQPNLFVSVSVNESVMVPLLASYLLSNRVSIDNLLVKLHEDSDLFAVKEKVQSKIRQLLPAARVTIRSPQQILALVAKQRATFTWLLAAIGGISLFVGAIGVMNILLVSVVERQREIGIRLAIGARRKNILVMFLIESVLLTVLGGLLGVFFGLAFSYIFAMFSHWEFQWLFMPPVLGFSVSVVVGLLSGLYPAFRASRLDPIVSLRSD